MHPAGRVPPQDRSTLFTSPVSFADFIFRIAFFSIAPFGIVAAAELFPVRGALIDVALALSVFVAGEAARRLASRSRAVRFFLSEALAFEGFYRARTPRPFAYYFFYPLLFPYWLLNRDARREFLVFRSYTFGSFVILVGSLVYQYWASWAPQLSVQAFLPFVAMSLVVETLLVLSLLMPIATTVVWYHSSYRRGRLAVVLVAGLVSTSIVVDHVLSRKHPIVSYSTRERVVLRTEAAKRSAHRAMASAARAAWRVTMKFPATAEGTVIGQPLETARTRLETFYKPDEAESFSIWASPASRLGTLLLYFQPRARPHAHAIWVAIAPDGHEIRKRSELPRPLRQVLRGGDEESDALPIWPEDLEIAGP